MRSTLARREAMVAYLYLLPWLMGLVFLSGGPLIAGVALGFTDWEISTKVPLHFVGVQNFVAMFTQDPLFYQSLKVTFVYAVSTLMLSGILSLGVALLINQNLPGMHLFRTFYYTPVMVSAVAMSIVWVFVAHRDFGVMNYVLHFFGIVGPDWLGSERWALPTVIMMSMWGIGTPMIILLAGLRGIPRELYEAAMVDGAGWRHRFTSVTLPMLSPTLFFNLVTGIILSLQLFTQVYILTQGGPNYATYFYAYNIYVTAFQNLRVGYASALADVMFVIILVLTLLTFKTSGRWVYYAGEVESK